MKKACSKDAYALLNIDLLVGGASRCEVEALWMHIQGTIKSEYTL